MSLHTWVTSHHGSLLIVACFGKGHYHPLLMSEAHTSHLLVVAMAPCHVPSSLSAAMSHGITPMTPNLCTRHCALVPSIRHYLLSWLGCCFISMPCPSPPWCNNGPWHCTHGSLSHLAQGIAPLYHHREGETHLGATTGHDIAPMAH